MDHQSPDHAQLFAPEAIESGGSVFWITLLAALDAHQIRHRVLHANDIAPFASELAIHPSDRAMLGKVFSELRRAGYRAVRSVKTCPNRHRIAFAKVDAEAAIETLDIDFRVSADKGRISADRLITQRQPSWLAACWQAVTCSGVRDGAFLVFLGPDGVGKTTLLTSVTTTLGPLFKRQHFFRWRPAMFARAPRPNAPPHSKPRRSTRGSLSYLAFLWLDFVAGYMFRTRKMLCQGDLVVYDRYYHDVLVDPRRYRYDGPRWLARLASRVVPPKTAFFVVLDADEQTIYARKQQLALADIRELRNLYRQFAQATPLSVVVITDRPLEQSTNEVVCAVLRYLADRVERRNPAWFGCNQCLGKEEPSPVSLSGSELSN